MSKKKEFDENSVKDAGILGRIERSIAKAEGEIGPRTEEATFHAYRDLNRGLVGAALKDSLVGIVGMIQDIKDKIVGDGQEATHPPAPTSPIVPKLPAIRTPD